MFRFAAVTAAAALVLPIGVAALEITPENWEEATAGKTVFLKFFAPWCGHCKTIKPHWDKLMAAYKGHATTLVADVDCISEGKELCEQHGVEGFPTIKYGDPSDLQDYEGKREFDDLKTFAGNLGPMCSPANLDACDDEKKAKIKELQAMEPSLLTEQVEVQEGRIKELETEFKTLMEELQKKYEAAEKKKTEEVKAIKDGGLGLIKAVLTHSKKAKAGSSEL